MDKIKRECLKMSKTMTLPTPWLILSITFDWYFEISNGFLEIIKDSMISQIYFVQSF